MIKRYEEYKYSGIVLVREIPEPYEVKYLKFVCMETKEAIKTGPFKVKSETLILLSIFTWR